MKPVSPVRRRAPRVVRRVVKVLALASALWINSAAVLAQDTKPLGGTFSNDQITLVIRPDGEGYTGAITVGGKTYKVAGFDGPKKHFVGSFEANGQEFPLTVEPRADGTILVVSDKNRHILRPAGAGPVMPNAPAPALPNVPAIGGPANHAPNAAAQLPAFIKPGYRISYHTGNSTREGVSLVPDPKGWIIKDGKRYSLTEHAGRGVEGIRNVTIQEASPESIVAEVRNFTIGANLQGKTLATGAFDLSIGAGAGFGDYWAHPAILQNLQPGREEDGQTTERVRFTAGGQQFDAVTIRRASDSGYSSMTFDLATGLCLQMLRTTATPDLIVKGPDGNHHLRGTAVIERLNFMGSRQVDFAWAGEPMPNLAKGFTLDYQGRYRSDIAQTPGLPPLPPMPGFAQRVTFTVQGASKQTVVAGMGVVKQIDRGGLTDQAQGNRVFGSCMYLGGIWASPRAMQKLQPNQVLDEDKATGYRTMFAGIRGNVGVFVEQGAFESFEFFYDTQSGILLGWNHVLRLLPGTAVVTEMQLVRQP